MKRPFITLLLGALWVAFSLFIVSMIWTLPKHNDILDKMFHAEISH